MRVGVLVRHPVEQQVARLEVGDQRLVRVLEELPSDQRDVVGEVTVCLHRVDHRQVVLTADSEVVGAERRSQVDDAGAVAGRHEVARDHVVRVGHLHQVEGPPVVRADELGAWQPMQDLGILAERGRQQILSDDQRASAGPGNHVGRLRGDRNGGVGHQRPGSGRPDQQRHTGELRGQRPVQHLASDEHRRVDDCLVALGQLVVAERRAAAWAVGGDPVVLLEQALVEDRLE